MIVIGIILCILTFFILCGICSLDSELKVMIKRQDEIIRLMKNSK